MAQEKTSRTKSQTLSLRLDPKVRFVLDFVSRIRGQSITTVVERAIKEAADNTKLPRLDNMGDPDGHYTWDHFWDPDEGVRTLKLLAQDAYPSTYEEDELRAFTLSHPKFFYEDDWATSPKRENVNVLWPKLDELLELWRESKSTDYWACAGKMSEILLSAGLTPPPGKSGKDDFAQELDDEIPF